MARAHSPRSINRCARSYAPSARACEPRSRSRAACSRSRAACSRSRAACSRSLLLRSLACSASSRATLVGPVLSDRLRSSCPAAAGAATAIVNVRHAIAFPKVSVIWLSPTAHLAEALGAGGRALPSGSGAPLARLHLRRHHTQPEDQVQIGDPGSYFRQIVGRLNLRSVSDLHEHTLDVLEQIA